MYKRKTISVKDLDCDNKDFVVSGYGSVFGNYDSDQDRMIKGCYNRSIQDWGPAGKGRIKMCNQHRLSEPLAVFRELEEDDYGLKFSAQFSPKVDDSRNAYYKLESGILSEISVGFQTLSYEDNEHKGWDIKDTKLYELSVVTFAANDKARVTDVKSQFKKEALDDLLKYIKTIDNKEQAFELERKLLNFQYELTGPSPAGQDPVEESDQDVNKWLEGVLNHLNI